MLTKISRYLFFSITLAILSCSEDISQASSNLHPVEINASPRIFMRTKSIQLNIRQNPDLDGKILKTLIANSIIEFLNDSTIFRTQITYNKQKYNSNWYKIKTKDEIEGWIYSAFADFLSTEENKKIVAEQEAFEHLEASNRNQPEVTPKQKKDLSLPVNINLVNKYKNNLRSLNYNDPKSITLAINKFTTYFSGTSNPQTCDAAYVSFYKYYKQVLDQNRKKNLSEYQHLMPEIKRYHKATMHTNDYSKMLAQNGFNFSIKNNKVIVAEDVDFLYRIFYKECSAPMRFYMNQYQLEEPNFWHDSDQLLISPTMLARWVLSWNYLVATYPEFLWHSKAKNRLKEKLKILLSGFAKTPAFNNTTKILMPEFLIAYRHIADKYPKSVIGSSFIKYLSVLEKNNWKNTIEIRQQQEKIMRTFAI
ncbi:SH3 domain-containing protein [Aureispira]|nr:SH3 domain-containing protein [Aureispira sp.]